MNKTFQRKELNTVLDFATKAHADQRRRYTGCDYINHPMRVAFACIYTGNYPGNYIGNNHTAKANAVAAALLHDVVEDTAVTFEDLRLFLSKFFFDSADVAEIMQMVMSLTNIYTKDNYPEMNRQERKNRELWRMADTFDSRLYLIKLIDMFDNHISINEHDPEFAKVFNTEHNNFICEAKKHFGEPLFVSHMLSIKEAFERVDSKPIYEHRFKGLISPQRPCDEVI